MLMLAHVEQLVGSALENTEPHGWSTYGTIRFAICISNNYLPMTDEKNCTFLNANQKFLIGGLAKFFFVGPTTF